MFLAISRVNRVDTSSIEEWMRLMHFEVDLGQYRDINKCNHSVSFDDWQMFFENK